MSKIYIELSNLKKSYKQSNGSVTLFNNLNIKIKEGELVALVGPSGSGKTSLLHLMALLDEPTRGKIILNNIDTEKRDINLFAVFDGHGGADVAELCVNLLPQILAKALGRVRSGFGLL